MDSKIMSTLLGSFQEIQQENKQEQAKADTSEDFFRKIMASMQEFSGEEAQKRTTDRLSAVKEMAATFQDIPKEDVQKQQSSQRIKEAIQDMRRLLVLWEKDLFGRSAETDWKEFAENRQKWEASILALRNYLTEKGEI